MSENITYRGLPECLPEYVKLPESRKPIWATIGRLWQVCHPMRPLLESVISEGTYSSCGIDYSHCSQPLLGGHYS